MATKRYLAYLKSNEWRCVRRIALHAAGHRCQLCASTNKLQVHHKTYENIERETLDDVIVLCGICHSKFHGKLAHITGDDAWDEVVAQIPEIKGLAAQIAQNSTCIRFSYNVVELMVDPMLGFLTNESLRPAAKRLEDWICEMFQRQIALRVSVE